MKSARGMWAAMGILLLAVNMARGQVFVAVRGSDQAAGSKAQPVATPGQAVLLARKGGEKQIVIGAGTYWDVGLELGAADSGLTIAGAAGEKVVLVGGVKLTGWQKEGDFVTAKLPAGPAWEVRMLQVNGRLCERARFPAKGTFYNTSVFKVGWKNSNGGGWERAPTTQELTTMQYKPADLPGDLAINNAEVTVYHSWDESSVGISRMDGATHTLTLAPPPTYPPGAFHHHEYVIWNTREGMTQPGQWFWDRVNGAVVYWPLPGEDLLSPGAAEAVAPTRCSVISIQGSKQNPVRGVTLKNVTVEVATVPLTAAGFGGDKYPGAVQMEGVDGVTIDGVTVRQVAGQGINTEEGCANVTIEGCEVSECGAGGIYVGGDKAIIKNNLVHGVGRMYFSGIGIHGNGTDCLLSHNEVHDTPYSAIDYRGQNVLIEYNLLYDCMKVLQDGAAIYMFNSVNCTMHGNVAKGFRDTGNAGAGAIAYYLDWHCRGCVIDGNLALDAPWPLHNNVANGNTIRNNVLVAKNDLRITFNECTNYTLEGNVFYAGGKVRMEIDDGFVWKHNVAFSETGEFQFPIMQGPNVEKESAAPPGDTLLDDPGFVDAASGDYRFTPDGAAGKLGLKGVDAKLAGRQ